MDIISKIGYKETVACICAHHLLLLPRALWGKQAAILGVDL